MVAHRNESSIQRVHVKSHEYVSDVALNFVPGDVRAFAAAHDNVAVTVVKDSTADGPSVASVTAALGPIAAEFVAALQTFHADFASAGTHLANDYRHTAKALFSGTQLLAETDAKSAAPFSTSPVPRWV